MFQAKINAAQYRPGCRHDKNILKEIYRPQEKNVFREREE
jgi:hypothetical protein